MVQFIPAPPSFGSQLAQVLEGAGGVFGEALQKRGEAKKAKSIFEVIADPNRSAIEKSIAVSQLPEQYQKFAAPVFAASVTPQATLEAEQAQLNQFRQRLQRQPGVAQGQIPEGASGIRPPAAAQEIAGKSQNQFNPADITTYPDEVLSQQAALSGIAGRVAQQEQGRRQVEHGKDVEALKATADYREKLLGDYEGSKRTLSQLNRLEALGRENKLTKPLMAKFAETTGIPLSILGNPASEEFQKLSQDLMSNITKYYGNRILQVEVDNFLKTIPTLMNSQEGRERVIKNMKMLLEPSKMAYDEYKKIRKDQGRVPLDLHEQILERIEPKLDKLAEDFKKNASDFIVMIAPDGSEIKVPRNKVDDALKAGGILK